MRRLVSSPLLIAALSVRGWAAPPSIPNHYPWQALTHARVYVTPEQVLEDATVLMEHGKIRQVSAGLTPPPEYRVWDCRGKVVHAGFIDPYLDTNELKGGKGQTGVSQPDGRGDTVDDMRAGGGEQPESKSVTPLAVQTARQAAPTISGEHLDALRGLGILTIQVVPPDGLLRGFGSIYSLRWDREQDRQIQAQSCQVVGLRLVSGGGDNDYPTSLMGNLAVLRQAFRELDWSRSDAVDPHTLALRDARQKRLPFYFEGNNFAQGLSLERALNEQEVDDKVLVTTPDAVLRPDWLQGKVVLTVDYPKIDTHPARRNQQSYARLQQWHEGPGLARRLQQRQLPFCFSVHRLKDWKDYPQRLYAVAQSGLSTTDLLDSLTRRPARWLGLAGQLGTLEKGRSATLVVRTGEPFAAGSKVEQVWISGLPRSLPEKARVAAKAQTAKGMPAAVAGPIWKGPGSVLIQHARVWTQGGQGVVDDCDVLVLQGKIKQVGRGLSASGVDQVVDGRGKHLLPGLIDAHSHTAVVGSVNEGTLTTTAQVDIADVIHPFDRNIQHQLAGGVTCAHVLHGSANAIGGRTVTLKWRWGARAEQLRMEGAPPGIKFALGENPKQSNWGDGHRSRYPQTRQGVAALIGQRFEEALEYRRLQKEGANPRPDVGLEALLEVLDGARKVHCHCYRQDEILMLLALAERFHFRIATLQHGLEAYKVADEVAHHGAGVSTFSDWWAYKLEVIDAIPYNGSLLHQRGVEVSFNSDSDDLARRLWAEAAKAVRYGELSEVEALNFLTMNPAHQLGVADHLGSIEVGKDGDLGLWTGSPFEGSSKCVQTWVDGRSVFELQSYRAEQEARRQLRQQWLQATPKSKGEVDS